jgi:hypothetical protein
MVFNHSCIQVARPAGRDLLDGKAKPPQSSRIIFRLDVSRQHRRPRRVWKQRQGALKKAGLA